MKKIVYRCPNEASCTLHKHCRVLTTPHELTEPLAVWIKCEETKKKTGGKETERLVEITEADKAA